MSDIYKFPMFNFRQEIRDGHVSMGTKDLISRVLIGLNEFHPNSWDKTFCEDILDNDIKKLSKKQSNELERILEDLLTITEHPTFTPKFFFDF